MLQKNNNELRFIHTRTVMCKQKNYLNVKECNIRSILWNESKLIPLLSENEDFRGISLQFQITYNEDKHAHTATTTTTATNDWKEIVNQTRHETNSTESDSLLRETEFVLKHTTT